MPSLLAQIAAARVQQAQQQGGGFIKRGPVTVYQPGGFVKRGPVRQQAPPPREMSRSQERDEVPPPDWDRIVRKVASSPAAKKKAEDAAKKAYEAANPPGLKDQLGKGLGILVNNPVTKAVLMPLNMLGMGRRGIEFGIEQFAENVPESAQQVINAIARQGAPQGAPTIRPEAAVARMTTAKNAGGIVDTERTRANDTGGLGQQFVSKVLDPRSDYGYGQFLDPKNGQWTNRLVGLGGDIATDPLTFVGAGSARLAGGAPKLAEEYSQAARLAQEARVAAAADPALEVVAAKAERQATKALDAFRKTQDVQPIHGGAASRAQTIADLTIKNPELAAEFQSELQRGGAQGFNRMSAEARRAFGIADPGLRIRAAGVRIPGTGAIGKGSSAIGAGLRIGAQRLPGGGRLRAPEGMEATRAILTGGQPASTEDFFRAVAHQGMMDEFRKGEGGLTLRGYRYARNLVRRDFKDMSNDAIRTATREAELSPEPNMVNHFFGNMRDAYERVTGVPMDHTLDPNTYVTHILTPEWKRGLRRLAEKGDVNAKSFMETNEFFTDDLLEGSGFLEKRRALKPTAPGVPTDIPIGNATITLKNGSIDELNTELRKAFPDFKGKFYQDDPVRIAEAYVNSTARDAGRMKALQFGAGEGALTVPGSDLPLVGRIEGEHAAELAARNEAFGQQNPLASYIEQAGAPPTIPATPEEAAAAEQLTGTALTPAPGAITPGAPLAELPTPPPAPKDTPLFSSEIAREATKEREHVIARQGPAVKQTLVADANAARQDVREALSDLRKDMRSSVRTDLKERNKALGAVERNIKRSKNEFARLSKERDVTAEELSKFITGIRSDITDIEQEIAHHEATYKGRFNRARRIVVNKLKANLKALREMESDARTKIAGAPAEAVRKATEDSNKLYAPVKAAERQLNNARTQALAQAGAPAPERITWAEGVLAGAERGDIPGTDALREEYRQALQGEGSEALNLQRTKSGRLTVQSQKRLDRRIVELRQQLQPTQNIVARAYDDAQAQVAALETQIAGTPARNTRQIRTMQAELDKLNAQFNNPGGRFYSERHARAVMMEQAQAEEEIAKTLAPYERELRKQQTLAENRAAYPPGAFQGVTEREQIAKTLGGARQERITQGHRVKYAQQRIPEMYERLGNIEAEPQLAALAEEHAANVDPWKARLDVAQDLRTGTVSDASAKINELDSARMEVQRDLHRSMDNRKLLADKRAELMRIDRGLYRAGEPMKAKAGQLEGVVEDIRKVAQANPLLDDDSLAATESLLQTHNEMLDEASTKAMRSKQVEKMMQDAKNGKLAKVMLTTLNDGLRMIHDGVLSEGDIFVDKQLYDMFQNTIKIVSDKRWVPRAFNAYTNLFKTYATLSPGFHVRNALGAIFMNSSDGVTLANQVDGVRKWTQWVKGGDEWLDTQPQHVKDAFAAVEASGAGGRFTEAGFAGTGTDRRSWSDRLASNKVTRLSQRAGERVEGSVRLGMALDSTRSGETVNETMSRISRVHFDYSQLSSFDQNMKRLVPFWTFMSRNLPLQISQMYTKPGLYAAYDSMTRNLAAPNEPFTPEYWTRGGAFNTGTTVPNIPGLGGAQGLPIYLNPDIGLQRAEAQIEEVGNALGGDWGGLASELNPGITAPIEWQTNHNFFTGQQYGPTDYSKVSGPLGIPTNVLARALGQTNDAGEVSESFQNFLRALNPVQERTARLLPQGGGGNEEDKRRQLESWLRFGGAPVRFLTPKQQQSEAYRRYFDIIDAQDAAEASARRAMAG